MMISEQGPYLRVEEMQARPQVLPLDSGFSTANAYRVRGLHNRAQTCDANFPPPNDRDEIWFICDRIRRTPLC